MFNFRFNQVFVLLLVLSGCSEFLLPANLADRFRGVGKLFAPVSFPARKIGAAFRDRLAPEQVRDDRDVTDVKLENAELRTLVHNLTGQLEEMRRITDELEKLGDIRAACTRYRVIGNDPAHNRESLTIPATTSDGVEPRMPVIYSVGVVGRIDRVNLLSAQVQLITDPNFRASGQFAKLDKGKSRVLKTTQPLVIGVGRGEMEIVNIPLRETAGNGAPDSDAIAVGDAVVLNDPDWPIGLQHRLLGRVESIAKHDKAATFARIRVRPLIDLETLSNVMVMNRAAADASLRSANVTP